MLTDIESEFATVFGTVKATAPSPPMAAKPIRSRDGHPITMHPGRATTKAPNPPNAAVRKTTPVPPPVAPRSVGATAPPRTPNAPLTFENLTIPQECRGMPTPLPTDDGCPFKIDFDRIAKSNHQSEWIGTRPWCTAITHINTCLRRIHDLSNQSGTFYRVSDKRPKLMSDVTWERVRSKPKAKIVVDGVSNREKAVVAYLTRLSFVETKLVTEDDQKTAVFPGDYQYWVNKMRVKAIERKGDDELMKWDETQLNSEVSRMLLCGVERGHFSVLIEHRQDTKNTLALGMSDGWYALRHVETRLSNDGFAVTHTSFFLDTVYFLLRYLQTLIEHGSPPFESQRTDRILNDDLLKLKLEVEAARATGDRGLRPSDCLNARSLFALSLGHVSGMRGTRSLIVANEYKSHTGFAAAIRQGGFATRLADTVIPAERNPAAPGRRLGTALASKVLEMWGCVDVSEAIEPKRRPAKRKRTQDVGSE